MGRYYIVPNEDKIPEFKAQNKDQAMERFLASNPDLTELFRVVTPKEYKEIEEDKFKDEENNERINFYLDELESMPMQIPEDKVREIALRANHVYNNAEINVSEYDALIQAVDEFEEEYGYA